MCEILSWEIGALSSDDSNNGGVHAMNEEEVDRMLSDSSAGRASEGEERPCSHNSWDNVRAKRRTVTLRCRMCNLKWKTVNNAIERCKDFTTGSCTQENCTKIHVHRLKFSVELRKAEQRAARQLQTVAAPSTSQWPIPPFVEGQ